VSRAIATHRRRRTWCSRAALPSPWRLGEEESGARAARDVPVSRERDAPSAAHMVRLRGAALSQERLGGREEEGARAARDVLASRDRDAPSAAHMVRPRGAAGPQRRLGRRKRAVSRVRYAPPATRRPLRAGKKLKVSTISYWLKQTMRILAIDQDKVAWNISKIRIEGMLYSLTRSP
jgi:hypothetical protein